MKRLFLFAMILCFVSLAFAQKINKFNSVNSSYRTAIVIYEKDSNGLFHKRENVSLDEVKDVDVYGLNKKTGELYCSDRHSNYVIKLHDNFVKYFKRQDDVPKLKEKELEQILDRKNKELEQVHAELNIVRQKQIEEAKAKAKEDSIRKAKEDSLRMEAEKNREIDYKNNHRWFIIPTKNNKLFCEFCEKTVDGRDSVFCYGLQKDTLYWAGLEEGDLNITINHIHAGKIPDALQKDKDFVYHRKVYNDSLSSRITIDMGLAAAINRNNYVDYMRELKSVAPNGFFLDWGWDCEYSSISFHFRYMNTNKNTIKYFEVFFVVTNDVGDIRKTGSFKGTGPLEEWMSASWNWDHSSYYVAGDASNMNISKVIITYTNGTKITIPKNKLRFN
jgi:hypothetical protein